MAKTSSPSLSITSIPVEKLDFSSSYNSLSLIVTGPLTYQNIDMDCNTYTVKFNLDWDISELFPYINAIADNSQLYKKPVYIRFLFAEHLCAFYPRRGVFAPVGCFAEAVDFLGQLIDFIIYIIKNRNEIVPNFKTYNPLSAVEIYRLLPGTNCKTCGFATCLAFAAALSRNRTSFLDCPYLSNPVEEKVTFPVYDDNGNCIRTVSLEVGLTDLRRTINKKDQQIKNLQSRLADFEQKKAGNMHQANNALPSPLTKREIQVLRLVARGATNKQISNDLNISEHTVKSHILHIFNKLGVNDRTQASVWAASNGVL
jgi:DNA-binding CsgD family transcriptional regulator/ArsR family metal-binding transcriptional regulator